MNYKNNFMLGQIEVDSSMPHKGMLRQQIKSHTSIFSKQQTLNKWPNINIKESQNFSIYMYVEN